VVGPAPHLRRELDLDADDARNLARGVRDRLRDDVLRRAGRRRELDRDDDAAAVDRDRLDEPRRDEVSVERGLLDAGERRADVFFEGGNGRSLGDDPARRQG
jgi:hypothetical protein